MGWGEGRNSKSVKELALDIQLTMRLGWKSNPGNDSSIKSHQYFNSYSRYNETMEDIHKANTG